MNMLHKKSWEHLAYVLVDKSERNDYNYCDSARGRNPQLCRWARRSVPGRISWAAKSGIRYSRKKDL